MPKFTSPVGTAEERASGVIWPGKWLDANPYLHHYEKGYHTGADLNLNSPVWDSDKRAPVYAIADGVVTCAKKFNVWGNVIVIEHGGVYARYAHVAAMLVLPGQVVKQGDQIATIGNADGKQPYHLHFDICQTDILRAQPNHWPGQDRNAVIAHYLDPYIFLSGQASESTTSPATVWVTADVLNIRAAPTTSSADIGDLHKGEAVEVGQLDAGWYKLANRAGYIFAQYTTPDPPGMIETVYVTADVLNIRAAPSTSSAVIGSLGRYAGVRVTPQSDTWWKLFDRSGFIFREFTTPLIPPPSAWRPPILATMRGLHLSAGGWSPSDVELDLVRRNKVKWVFIAAYELGQAGAINRLRLAGVEQFVFRAAARLGDVGVQHFLEYTLPRLEQYANALGSTQGMMIQLHNEPNLVNEGAGLYWHEGGQFATWWQQVAAEYRRRFPGAKLGFPALSPGGSVENVRLDEATFVAQAASAIREADWVGVHYYWTRPDGTDINPPASRWFQWFGTKALLGTEIGPADKVQVTARAVERAYTLCAAANVPAAAWVSNAAGGPWGNAAWDTNRIVLA